MAQRRHAPLVAALDRHDPGGPHARRPAHRRSGWPTPGPSCSPPSRRSSTPPGTGLRQAIKGFDGRIRNYLSTDNDTSPLVNVEKGSTDPEYIGQLVTWLGFPEVDESNTTLPIKQEMAGAFEKVMWEVNRELQRAAGMR